VQLTYEYMVVQQHYRDGKPGFRPEAIGVPRIATAYADSLEHMQEHLDYWVRADKCWAYRPLEVKVVSEADIPAETFIFSARRGGAQGYRKIA
jgi:hypothetical protein